MHQPRTIWHHGANQRTIPQIIHQPPKPNHCRTANIGEEIMLVLSRNPYEKLKIGEEITVTYLGLDSRGHVRLGFDAPENIKILREELYLKIKLETILDNRLKTYKDII
jgi:carbon storage regulator CsrA